MKHMSVVIAGYLRLVSQNPNLNRFVINRRIYSRNHFAVSFVALKPSSKGGSSETVIKLYFNMDDDIFEVNRKVEEAIEKTEKSADAPSNATDKFLQGLNKVPGLMASIVGFLKLWDKYFGLPFSIIDASPFHTSLFISNCLANLDKLLFGLPHSDEYRCTSKVIHVVIYGAKSN